MDSTLNVLVYEGVRDSVEVKSGVAVNVSIFDRVGVGITDDVGLALYVTESTSV